MSFRVHWLGTLAAVSAPLLSACQGDPINPRPRQELPQTAQAEVRDGDILTGFSATLTVRTWEEGVPTSSLKRHPPVSFRVTSVRREAGTWNLEVSILGEGRGSAIRTVMVPGDGSPVRYLDESGGVVTAPPIFANFPDIPAQLTANRGPLLRDGWHEAFIIAVSDREALAAKRQRLYGPGIPLDSRHDAYRAEPSPGNRVEEVVDRETGALTDRAVFRNGSLHARESFHSTPLPGGGGYLLAEARTVYASKLVVERTLTSVSTTFSSKQ